MRLFAVGSNGPRRLSVPDDVGDPTRVFDALPRGIYEALRTFGHVRFVGLEAHLDRAELSMERMGLPGGLDRLGLRHALHRVVEDAPWPDSRVRFDVLAGTAEVYGSSERVLVQIVPLVLPPPDAYELGVTVALTRAVRRERPAVKEAQWVVDRRAAMATSKVGYDPILVDRQDRMLEGVMSNLFLVRGDALWTAPTRGVLAGVTRAIVIELARAGGIEVVEDYVRAGEIETLAEAFFSTSVRSVLPVVRIDGRAIGAGRPGPLTRRLMAGYAEHCRREARPAIEPL